MKKLLVLLLTVSVGFNFYLIDVEYVVQDDFNNEPEYYDEIKNVDVSDEVKLAQSSISKKQNKRCSCDDANKKISKNSKQTEPQKKDEIEGKKEIDEVVVRERLQELHKEWLEKSDRFFVDDLRLSQDQILKYHELSVLRDKEIDDYWNVKHGDNQGNTTYIFDSNDTIFMGKITEKYNNLLKENFGQESFSRYQDFLQKHNQVDTENDFIYTIQF